MTVFSKTELKKSSHWIKKNECIFKSKHIKLYALKLLFKKKNKKNKRYYAAPHAFVFCFNGITVARSRELSLVICGEVPTLENPWGERVWTTADPGNCITGLYQPANSWQAGTPRGVSAHCRVGEALYQTPFPQFFYLAGRNTRSDSRTLPGLRPVSIVTVH